MFAAAERAGSMRVELVHSRRAPRADEATPARTPATLEVKATKD